MHILYRKINKVIVYLMIALIMGTIFTSFAGKRVGFVNADTTEEQAAVEIKIVAEDLKVYYTDNPDLNVNSKTDDGCTVYYLNNNAVLVFRIAEGYQYLAKACIQTIKNKVEQLPYTEVKPEGNPAEVFSKNYDEEGEYTATVWGTDGEGNAGEKKSIDFVVDKTAPDLKISGAKEEGMYKEERTLRFSATDLHHDFDSYKVRVEWTTPKGTTTEIYGKGKNDFHSGWTTPTQSGSFTVSNTIKFTEDGDYKITFSGEDLAGNIGETVTVRFQIDKERPQLYITGIKNGEQTAKTVTLDFTAIDQNHDESKYEIRVIRTDLNGVHEVTGIHDTEWKKESDNRNTKQIQCDREGNYEVCFDAVDKAGNVADTEKLTFSIDNTAPVISGITYSDADGKITAKYNNIYSNKEILVEFNVTDAVTGVKRVYVTTGTEEKGQNQYTVHKAKDNTYYVCIPEDVKLSEPDNVITIRASDGLDNKSNAVSANINYNTAKPQIQMDCKDNYAMWTNQDVTFDTTVSDNRCGLKEAVYRINGKPVKKVVFDELTYSYDYTMTAAETAGKETGYAMEIEVTNNCGTNNTMKRRVYIDKSKPGVSLSGVSNGAYYNNNQIITTNVCDVSYKDTKTVYFATRKLDGKKYSVQIPEFYSNQYNDSKAWEITQEGLYEIYAVATDGAGNQSRSNTLRFVIDKTAPVLSISGVDEGSMNGTPTAVVFKCCETFYETNNVAIQVEKTLDGRKNIQRIEKFPKNEKITSMNHIFSEDGTYKVTMSATDKAGNTAITRTITFCVDRTKPEISITGTDNYEMWKGPAKVRFSVKETNFSKNNVYITGTRRDAAGKIYKVDLPEFSNYNKISVMEETFLEDGFYEIDVISKDEAGNHSGSRIHFTIDQTPPEIKKVEEYAGGCYKEFRLAESIEDIFNDLTIISYRILLNGIEYNGTDKIDEEGKYTLCVEAEDELGHVTKKSAEFIIAHTEQQPVPDRIAREEIADKSTVVKWRFIHILTAGIIVLIFAATTHQIINIRWAYNYNEKEREED